MDIKRYYSALETRLGNWLLFGGRAHLAYYDANTWWPFPIHRALLAMEDHIFDSLQLDRRARVLDAGCGDGQVAIHMAAKGLRVHAIDVLAQQVDRAQRNVRRAIRTPSQTPRPKDDAVALDIVVRRDDYHHLVTVRPASLDGIYTIETLVHASDLIAVLKELRRVLKPGGRVAFYEYDHWAAAAQEKAKSSVEASQADEKVREYGAIAPGSAAQPESLAQSLVRAGFCDVQETDLSRNVRPLLRVLMAVLFIPCMLVLALRLEAYCINTIAVVVNYRRGWKYVAVTGRKPNESEESNVATA
ncbi:S-adenosyl-L-methionine-dependent methyltransferase [Aspergillus steynii IBT 23096]|uniref:S-adenosyl-L-methionine-dependent methyltransferase n=1 Tax=Aspergillus steynii IBT 23096 TaxID=1392250 RepID=A0A2I2FX43_9EURO|nr:S-adenosyl-L-methionine-dependent methyltransferase [Aspergillus steynii IBT 23096]PLB45208.1 S-adenosyl-L-methionine-dependent methyltransferase [Aspergillus steynii IBT 23096]